jgi:F-type H+-transporting ATPase subunit a
MGITIFGTMPLGESSLLDHVVWHKLSREPMVRLFEKDIYFSSHQLMLIIAGVLTAAVFCYVGAMSKKRQVPTGLQNFFEAMLSFMRTEVFRPALKENADRFTPLLWTFFFFVLFCNLLGLIPVGQIASLAAGRPLHFWGTPTGNLLVTAGLAIMAFIMIHVMGVTQQIRIAMDPSLDPHHHAAPGAPDEYGLHKGHSHDATGGHGQGVGLAMAVPVGVGKYIWNFAPHPDTGLKVMDLGLFALLLVLEMIGALVKPFALCIRLFANMIAGHLVLGALVSLVPFTAGLAMMLGVSIPVALGCAGLSILELFVAFLQAYIFTFLTTLFLASAVAPEH